METILDAMKILLIPVYVAVSFIGAATITYIALSPVFLVLYYKRKWEEQGRYRRCIEEHNDILWKEG